ncbi:MAG TPA: AI-2E family transporter [Terriglobales bacterium]|nr:AI-2E family transporter [Terriglobales bacterium]
MAIFDTRTARVLATILVYALALGFIYLAWRTLVTFLFAILFAYLLEPVVTGMEARLHLTRGKSVLVLYLAMGAALGLFLFFVGPQIVQQAENLSKRAPQLQTGVATGQIAQKVGSERGWSYDTQYQMQQFLIRYQAQIKHGEQVVMREVGNLAANLEWVLLIPVFAIFFLLSGGHFASAILEQLARRRQRAFVGGLLSEIHDVLANYIRAQIALTGLALVVYLVGFEIMRVPYAVAFGALAGVLEFIPVIGPLVGAVVVLGGALFLGYTHMIELVIFLGVWRLVQDYVNSPRIMGNQLQLHPLAVLFGVFAGGEIAGVIGVYLSIPIMATLRVIWIRWRSFENAKIVVPPGAGPPPPIIEGVSE